MSASPSRPLIRLSLTASAVLAALSPLALAQSLPDVYPQGARRGAEAVELLGDRLPELAERGEMTVAELRQRMLDDTSTWVTPEGRVFFLDPAAPAESGDGSDTGSYSGDIPTSQAFLLHSNPGASKTIYLDFTGHHSVNNSWGHDIVFPPYNTQGSSSSFSTGELNDIITHWKYVVEDFAFLDVDVTTEEPPLSALTKSNGSDTTYGIRCVITQPTQGFGDSFGGIAFLNSFNDSIDNPCFNVNKGLNTGSMTSSHEVGHTLGLSHDGLNGQQYHPGSGSGETSWGPIMGAPFGASLVLWDKGDYAGATTTQNDITIITNSSNGINIIDDDHGDVFGAGSPIPEAAGCPDPTGVAMLAGVIERRGDVDAFTFMSSGGMTTVAAVPDYSPGGNLDLQLELLDPNGLSLGIVNPGNQTDASLSLDLGPGLHTVLVDGVGKDPTYTDYGVRGQYTVQVSAPTTQIFTSLGGGVPGGIFSLLPGLVGSGSPCAGQTVELLVTQAPANSQAFLAIAGAQLGVPFKGGVLHPDVTGALGLLIPLQVSFIGTIQTPLVWPAGLPPATTIYAQYWIKDPLAQAGWAATDGLSIFAP